MSNKTDLQSLNSEYSALIETLRGKAVGGSSVETTPVTITTSDGILTEIGITRYIDGKVIGEIVRPLIATTTLTDVVRGSMIVCTVGNTFDPNSLTLTNATSLTVQVNDFARTCTHYLVAD